MPLKWLADSAYQIQWGDVQRRWLPSDGADSASKLRGRGMQDEFFAGDHTLDQYPIVINLAEPPAADFVTNLGPRPLRIALGADQGPAMISDPHQTDEAQTAEWRGRFGGR